MNIVSLIILILLITIMSAAVSWANLPAVYVSYSTEDCVKVVNYLEEDNYSCSDMPKKYNHIYLD